MKRVIVASDSFKGTLSSVRVYEIIKEVLTEEYNGIEVTGIPVADGGEGTVDAFLCALGGERVYTTVKSPLMRDIESFYGLLPDGTAVIELAAASGITIEKEPDAVNSSTFGTGQLILHAVENGTKKVVLGIGGSATTDGGMGCAAALGVKFLDKNGCSVPLSGKGLSMVEKVDLSGIPEAVKSAEITVLCDVNNPLYGKNGAAYIYSPQKGADKKTVEYLDKGLRNLAEKTEKSVGKDFSSEKGAGAAGGMGFAMISFFNAKQKKQAEEYRTLGMTEEQIQAMYEFDLEQFNSERRYREHTQAFIPDDFDENEDDDEKLSIFEKFKDCQSEICDLTARQAFTDGFILAARIMVEVMDGMETVEEM